jgi:hypothetical protein
VAWIESHQALGHHPKTLRLAAALRCRVPEAVGYLHFLWWWALDYAPDGVVAPDDTTATHVARACLWRGNPDVFWSGLRTAGFVDSGPEGDQLHDWMDYAGRLLERRRKDAERKRSLQRTSGGIPPDVRRTVPDLPDRTVPPKPPLPDLPEPPAAGGADGAPPRAAAESQAEPELLRNGAGQCPLCRQAFTGTYLEHTAAKHRVNADAKPGNLFGRHQEPTAAPSPEMQAQFAAMHERLQSLPEQAEA